MPAELSRFLAKALAGLYRQHHAEKTLFGDKRRGDLQQRLVIERGGVTRAVALRRGALNALCKIGRIADDKIKTRGVLLAPGENIGAVDANAIGPHRSLHVLLRLPCRLLIKLNCIDGNIGCGTLRQHQRQ